jgi:branched-chain amino acid transport system permease protein
VTGGPAILRAMRPAFLWAAVALAFTLIAPQALALFAIINLTTAIALAILALSLALVWGYGGILSFGQVAFFGLGAYAYTIAAVNFGGTTGAVLVAVLVACAVAAALGYFMFYGRLSDVYLGVITLTFTLILFSVMRRTAGPEWRIGDALLGGFNGISAPPLNVPGLPAMKLFPEQVFYVAMVALILCYLLAAWLVNTHFGRVCVAIRENETRAELLGYDTRLYKLGLFTIGAGIAAVGGVFFANGIGRVTPDVFGLYKAALVIIWVIVGGRGTLAGPVIAAFAFFYLTAALGGQTVVNNSLVLGAILIVFVLAVPRGLAPTALDLWRRGARPPAPGRIRRRRARPEPAE